MDCLLLSLRESPLMKDGLGGRTGAAEDTACPLETGTDRIPRNCFQYKKERTFV